MENKNPLDYVINMGKALSAWRDENTDKRAVITLALAEGDDKPDDSGRTACVYMDGSPLQMANLLCCMMEKNHDFRMAVGEAINMAADRHGKKKR